MHHLSQNSAAYLIRSNSINFPRGDFELQLSTLTAKLDGLRQLMEVGIFNKVVGLFNSLTYVTIWVRENFPSDTPEFEHFIEFRSFTGRNSTDISEHKRGLEQGSSR